MPETTESIPKSTVVRAALRQAWRESEPGLPAAHEEGGFIVRVTESALSVVRWPRGRQYSILVPAHQGCTIEGKAILASFHTHPNTAADVLQEPSETDKRAVQNDADLKGAGYVGELVVSKDTLYLITPTGRVVEVGVTAEILTD